MRVTFVGAERFKRGGMATLKSLGWNRCSSIANKMNAKRVRDSVWRAAETFNPSSRWNIGPKTWPEPQRPGMMRSVRWNSGCISRIRPKVTPCIENVTHSFVRHVNRNPLAQLGSSSLSGEATRLKPGENERLAKDRFIKI